MNHISWDSLAELIFNCYLPKTIKNNNTSKLFSKLWKRLSGEFLDEDHINEYNSIKHGFRVKSGGFGLAIGTEHEYGVSPPANEMQLIGKSDYGTSFFKLEKIGETNRNRSLRSRRVSLNWKVEKTALLLQLISMSIVNVTSALKIMNGAKAGECKFSRPTNDLDFDKPWEYTPGVTSFRMDYVINANEVVSTTKKELLDRLKKLTRS